MRIVAAFNAGYIGEGVNEDSKMETAFTIKKMVCLALKVVIASAG